MSYQATSEGVPRVKIVEKISNLFFLICNFHFVFLDLGCNVNQ